MYKVFQYLHIVSKYAEHHDQLDVDNAIVTMNTGDNLLPISLQIMKNLLQDDFGLHT